jgi:uncharacterized protein
MTEEFIDYSALVDEAMHIIVRKSLEIVAKKSFFGDHHFFISFITKYPGVLLSDKLRKKYPDEMTIVLQFQFEDLQVHEDHFSVILSFDNVKETISAPYAALTAFADPSVKFGLQFKHYVEEFEESFIDEEEDEEDIGINSNKKKNTVGKEPIHRKLKSVKMDNSVDTNVVQLDQFRNKPK